MPVSRYQLDAADQAARELEPVTPYQRVLTSTLIDDFDQFLSELAGDSANTGSREHFEYEQRSDDLLTTLQHLEPRIAKSLATVRSR